LKDSVREAKIAPSGKGTMVSVYGTLLSLLLDQHPVTPLLGLGNSSAVGPEMVSQLASSFLDALYKA